MVSTLLFCWDGWLLPLFELLFDELLLEEPLLVFWLWLFWFWLVLLL